MKKILTIFLAAFLVSCYSGNSRDFLYGTGGMDTLEDVLNSEYIQLDIYLDIGLVKFKSEYLYALNGAPQESVVDAVLLDNLCGRRGFARDSSWLGCTIRQDDVDPKKLNSTCLLYIDHFYLEKNTSFTDVLGNLFRGRTFEITRDQLRYNITYSGNELEVEGRTLNKPDGSENLHVLSFSSSELHHTIVLKKDKTDLNGYKPLKLDPSILPLKSPGYKKLLEYEESFD